MSISDRKPLFVSQFIWDIVQSMRYAPHWWRTSSVNNIEILHASLENSDVLDIAYLTCDVLFDDSFVHRFDKENGKASEQVVRIRNSQKLIMCKVNSKKVEHYPLQWRERKVLLKEAKKLRIKLLQDGYALKQYFEVPLELKDAFEKFLEQRSLDDDGNM